MVTGIITFLSLKDKNATVGCLDVDRMMAATQVNWKELVEHECPKTGISKTYTIKDFMKMQLPLLIGEFRDTGKFKVSENLLEKYGFRKGRDLDGNVVEQNGTDDDYCISRTMIIL